MPASHPIAWRLCLSKLDRRIAAGESDPHDAVKHPNRPVIAALVLVGVAFAVRTLSLTQQSLWLDEVYSIWFVNRPFDEAWRVGIFPDQNPHAPLYYLVLWGWLQAAGASDFAVRYLSVLFGVASVTVVWRAAREWLGFRTGLIAALLVVCSPFAIHFAQEGRMYALCLMLGALSFLCMIRALKPDRNPFRYWLGMAAASVALAYSHFFGVFWIAAQYVVVLVVAWPAAVGASVTQPRRHPLLQRYAPIVATGALAALACLPIPISLMGSRRTYSLRDVTSPVIPLGAMLRDLVAEFATRTRWADLPENWALALTIPLVGLLLAGLVLVWRKAWQTGLTMTGLLTLPVLIYVPFWQIVGVFQPRYVIPLFLPCVLAWAVALAGAARRWRRAGMVLATAIVVYFSVAHLRDLTRPEFQREDWRFAGDYLSRVATASDRIIVFVDYIEPVLRRYYDGPAEILPYAAGLDVYQPEPFFDEVQSPVDVRTLWLVLSHDMAVAPNHRLLDVARVRYPWVRAQYPTNGNIRILAFASRWRWDALPPTAAPMTRRFAGGLELVGYHVDMTRLSPRERVSHPPSNWIHVITYWRRWGPVDFGDVDQANLRLQIRLVDEAYGEWGGDLLRLPDVFDFDPPATWPEDAIIEAHADINLNPITPPGMYRLILALAQDGQRLPLQDGSADFVLLSPVEITP